MEDKETHDGIWTCISYLRKKYYLKVNNGHSIIKGFRTIVFIFVAISIA